MDGTDEEIKMAMLTVCTISDKVHRALRMPAARRGHSLLDRNVVWEPLRPSPDTGVV